MSITGGTITTDGLYTIHTFTSSGDFIPDQALECEILIVGGGGGGGGFGGGGGGAGGYLASASESFSATTYAVTVGAGGAKATYVARGGNGGSSGIDTIDSVSGGGGGGCYSSGGQNGLPGGSGGGAGSNYSGTGGAGTGTEGYKGGNSLLSDTRCAGGGGASEVGHNYDSETGKGGDGKANSISGASLYYAGGGGAGNGSEPAGAGGAGGGGAGMYGSGVSATDGTDGLGGGGGGVRNNSGSGSIYSGAGGSGVVIIRYLTPVPLVTIDETITIDDTFEILTNPLVSSIDDTVTVTDNWELHSNPEQAGIDDTITIDDTFEILTNPLFSTIDDTVNISDSWNVSVDYAIDYISKIISYNPLIVVTDTDPAIIAEIDISTPSVPVKSSYVIAGCKSAKDVVYNATNGYFYVLCADGKVAKIDSNNLNTQSIISTGETDLLQFGTSLDTFFKTYASTDDTSGEIVMIDEATIKNINTDFRFIAQIAKKISTQLNTILGKLLNTDFRFIAQISKTISTDIRFLKYAYTSVNNNGIDYSDWQVKINGTDLAPLNDVNMKSIQIVHNVDEDYNGSVATFILNRRHDKLDYDNVGTSSQITNNNAVIILIDGTTEFTGTVSSLAVNSDTETVTVTAFGTISSSLKNSISIPLPSVNEQIHLYHCLINDVNIDNPLIDSDNPNPSYYKGVRISLGEEIEQSISRWASFHDVAVDAQKVEDGTLIPKQNWIYFWFATAKNYITGRTWGTSRYIGKSLSSLSADAWQITGISYKYQRQYDDIVTLLGEGTVVASDFDDTGITPTASIITALKSSNYLNASGDIQSGFKTLQSFSDMGINYTNNEKSLIYDAVKDQLGYSLGSAPYNVISSQNGIKITKDKWVDRSDGLYRTKDEGYNYVDYCKIIAAIEYEKLKNINGQVLPITSANIDISLDAYYYYNVKLLSRINVTNTTTSNIYTGNNGFPVGVKTITINSGTMKVTLGCDNQKSQQELEELDDTYPNVDDDAYLFEEENVLNYSKYDMNRDEYPA